MIRRHAAVVPLCLPWPSPRARCSTTVPRVITGSMPRSSSVLAASSISAARRSAVGHPSARGYSRLLGPAQALLASVERGHHLVEHAGRLRRRRRIPRYSASSPLTITERIILIALARPMSSPTMRILVKPSASSSASLPARCGPASSKRHCQRCRVDRRHHRDIDIAPAGSLDRLGRLRAWYRARPSSCRTRARRGRGSAHSRCAAASADRR